MTKSRQSAIKLRLSRLIKCLAAIGCLKLAIMGAAFFDFPMPAWPGADEPKKEEPAPLAEYSAPASNEPMPQVSQEEADDSGAMPLGSAAAELAAAAKPKPQQGRSVSLPTPLVPAGPATSLAAEGSSFIMPALPEPPALDAPLARAGVIVPEPAQKEVAARQDSIWNMLDLKSLPIPVLGSAQAAHAASTDMPVPNAPVQPSPFAPAEQSAALAGQPTVLPGAPPLPVNIPNGQAADGSPLPLRAPSQTEVSGLLPPLPAQGDSIVPPAPHIPPKQSMLDHNAKSQELARQQQDILMLRQQMDQRMKELQDAEDKMKGILREAKDTEEKKVKSLVQMYANMKPRMAAQALENMDERVAVRILSGMAPKQSGEILTYTNPAKTAKFTEMITRLRMGE